MNENDKHQINLQNEEKSAASTQNSMPASKPESAQNSDNPVNPSLMDYMDKPKSKNNMILAGIMGVSALLIFSILGYYIFRYFNNAPKQIFQNENDTPAKVDIVTEDKSTTGIMGNSQTNNPIQTPDYLNPEAGDYEGILVSPQEIANYNNKPVSTKPSTPSSSAPSAPSEPIAPKPTPSTPSVGNNIVEAVRNWIANDYKFGDIKGNSYRVIRGDTLWEISEGKYGQGKQWIKIKNANNINDLKNGNPLIIPGQNLSLPE